MNLNQLLSAFEGQFVFLRSRRRDNERLDAFIERVTTSRRFKQRIQFYNHYLCDEEIEHSPFLAMCLFCGIATQLGFDQMDIECELRIDEDQFDNLFRLYQKYVKKMNADKELGIKPSPSTAQGKFSLKLSLIRNYLKVNYRVEI